MVAMLPGESRLIGIIMLANRFGLERGYGVEDLRLLEVLANNASVALQYDRLEQAVTKLPALQEELHHQAYHDPLTGLPNRLMFLERLRGELADGTGTLGVLFIDVDDFKIVNDTLGHAVGDALLVAVAAGCGIPCAPRTSSPGWAATSSRSCCRGVEDPVAEARRRRHARAARVRDAGARRRRAGHRPPQRRHRRQPPHARPRRADPRGRPGHVPGEDVGQGPFRVLRPADGGRDAPPPRPQGRSWPRRSSARRSSSSTSRSSTSRRAASAPPRRSRAGSTLSAVESVPRSSSRWPRSPA